MVPKKTPVFLEKKGVAHRNARGKLVLAQKGIEELFSKKRFGTAVKRQRAIRKSFPARVSWRGSIIQDMAHNLATAHISGKKHSLRSQYISLRKQGHKITYSQFRGAYDSIFKGVRSVIEYYERADSHRSYGDWWKNLTSEQKKAVREKRRQTIAKKIREQLVRETRAIRKQGGRILNAQFEADKKAEEKIKFIEKNNPAGKLRNYPLIAVPLRSSWEALFVYALSKTGRDYLYEPMGFPLVDPKTKRVMAYHPDFLVMNPKTGLVEFVEIKGRLEPVSAQKIRLFIQYYLKRDFHLLDAKSRGLMKHLVEQHAKKFDETIGRVYGKRLQEVCLKVYGAQKWDYQKSLFKKGEGFIPKLVRRYPDIAKKMRVQTIFNEREKPRVRADAARERKSRVTISDKEIVTVQWNVALTGLQDYLANIFHSVPMMGKKIFLGELKRSIAITLGDIVRFQKIPRREQKSLFEGYTAQHSLPEFMGFTRLIIDIAQDAARIFRKKRGAPEKIKAISLKKRKKIARQYEQLEQQARQALSFFVQEVAARKMVSSEKAARDYYKLLQRQAINYNKKVFGEGFPLRNWDDGFD